MPNAKRRRLALTQSELQRLFDQLMRGEPFASDPEYGAFAAGLISSEIESLRWVLRGPEPEIGVYHEELPDGRILCRPKPINVLMAEIRARQDAGGRPAMARGRPSSRAERFALIQQVHYAFGRERTRLSQRRDHVKPGSHFEETVTMALELAGVRVVNVHRECIDALKALRNPQ